MIIITDLASEKLKVLLSKNVGKGLRILVQPG